MRKSVLLSASLLAMVALAALPASASASPLLKGWTTGAAVKAGAGITGHFASLGFTTSSGNYACTTVLEGEVKENTGTKLTIEFKNIYAVGEYGTTGKTCLTTIKGPGDSYMRAIFSTDGSAPWCLEATAGMGDAAELVGGACGGKTYPVRFSAELYEGIEPHKLVATCTYESDKEKEKAIYDTKVATLTMVFNAWAFTRKAGGASCPATGKAAGAMQLISSTSEATYIE